MDETTTNASSGPHAARKSGQVSFLELKSSALAGSVDKLFIRIWLGALLSGKQTSSTAPVSARVPDDCCLIRLFYHEYFQFFSNIPLGCYVEWLQKQKKS